MLPSRLLFVDLKGTELAPDERELLASRRFGGICLFGCNIRDRFQLADYVAEVRALAGAELCVAIDQEGTRHRYPSDPTDREVIRAASSGRTPRPARRG